MLYQKNAVEKTQILQNYGWVGKSLVTKKTLIFADGNSITGFSMQGHYKDNEGNMQPAKGKSAWFSKIQEIKDLKIVCEKIINYEENEAHLPTGKLPSISVSKPPPDLNDDSPYPVQPPLDLDDEPIDKEPPREEDEPEGDMSF